MRYRAIVDFEIDDPAGVLLGTIAYDLKDRLERWGGGLRLHSPVVRALSSLPRGDATILAVESPRDG